MNADEATDRPLRDFGLWVGIVGPPSLWLIQFQSVYMLVYPACGTGRTANIGLTCAAFFLAIGALGIYPHTNWKRNRTAQNPIGRTRRFMSIVGLMTTALFLLVVIAQWIAGILIDPCTI
jgi:hypothetical protein